MYDKGVKAIEDAVGFCHVLLLPRNQYLLEDNVAQAHSLPKDQDQVGCHIFPLFI